MSLVRPITKAIADKDVELVALLYRAYGDPTDTESSGVMRELELRTRGVASDMSHISPEDLLLAVVAPSPTIREMSLRKAEELVAVGPFGLTKKLTRPRLKLRPGKKCGKGHELTEETTGVYKHTASGKYYHSCLICSRARKRVYDRSERGRDLKHKRNRERRSPGPTDEQWVTAQNYRCPNRHQRTRENTVITGLGHVKCRECLAGARTGTPVSRKTSSTSSAKDGSRRPRNVERVEQKPGSARKQGDSNELPT